MAGPGGATDAALSERRWSRSPSAWSGAHAAHVHRATMPRPVGQGVGKRAENADMPVAWHTVMRPSVRRALKKNPLGRAKEKLEQAKASVRAKVEHCFHGVKCLFKHRKTRYRGLAKNNAQLFTLFAFLVLARTPKAA